MSVLRRLIFSAIAGAVLFVLQADLVEHPQRHPHAEPVAASVMEQP